MKVLSRLKSERKPKGPARAAAYVPTRLIFDLRKVRLDKGVVLRQAAKASGVSHPTLARVELGAMPDLATAMRISAFYELPIENIWKLK